MAATTEYVMVVGPEDEVTVDGPLVTDVAYMATTTRTRRAVRHHRSLISYDSVLMSQLNYAGRPILKTSLAHLFPEVAVDPWHAFLRAAQSAGATIAGVAGLHTVVEPWPRPVRSEVQSEFRTSFDPAASHAEAVNSRPYPLDTDPRPKNVTLFHRGCGEDFLSHASENGVNHQSMPVFNLATLQACPTEYVCWFDGIEESGVKEPISWLVKSLLPGVLMISPTLVSQFTVQNLRLGRWWLRGGIYEGFEGNAWLARTKDIQGMAPPGHITSYVTLRKA